MGETPVDVVEPQPHGLTRLILKASERQIRQLDILRNGSPRGNIHRDFLGRQTGNCSSGISSLVRRLETCLQNRLTRAI